MISFFTGLFEYNHHFNQKLVQIFQDHPLKVSEKSVKLISHMLNAHQIWNNRINPKQSPFGVWQLNRIEELKRIDQINFEQTLQILDDSDLSSQIRYTNSKGEAFINTVGDILFHVINHSTHHRGQLASEFRQAGLDPLTTDYIFYKRASL